MDDDCNPELKLSLIPECECNCQLCRESCLKVPCWGTPKEIENLINTGYGDRLARYVIEPGSYNIPNYRGAVPVDLISPARFGYVRGISHSSRMMSFKGRCVFAHGKGRKQVCELHPIGLKPVEGRVSSHTVDHDDGMMIRYLIIDTWDTDFGRSVMRRWSEEFLRSAY